MEQIGRRHFAQVAVKELTADAGHGGRRLQQVPIAHAFRSAEACDLVPMDGDDFIQREKHCSTICSAGQDVGMVMSGW
jgi:hypothetical protein